MKRAGSLVLWVIVCLSIGWAGGLATQSSVSTWYVDLAKPPLTPPSGVFAPVWSALYVAMAVAGWVIWGLDPQRGRNLRFLFIAQLALNGAWSHLFFGLRSPLMGLIDIALLWVCLLALVRAAWIQTRPAGFLLLPYWLWVSFASYLNAGIAWLNR